MSTLSQLPIDVKIEVVNWILDDIRNLRYEDRQKLKLIELINTHIQCNPESALLKSLLKVDNLQDLLNGYIKDAQDIVQDEAMRDD
jgi:hypothetical protein